MALIIEDGTIVANADAYVTVAEVDTYNTNYVDDATFAALSDTLKELAIRQATQFVDSCFGAQWIGVLVETDQSLDWPRSGAVGNDGRVYENDEIPVELKRAVSRLAITATTEDLTPDIDNPGVIKRTKDVVGPLSTEVEYFSASQQKLFTTAQKLLDSLIKGGSGQIDAVRS